ncbi:MAG TPA: hypothetical protein VHW71_02590 [Steroidobacteraceae bacterium]|jgi:hypothetical protein|nr:hypothetical protein [Steroidobacteraceae bacterium]
MKIIGGILLAAALMLFSVASDARGTPSSSFVPRGPEPHASLSDKHHAHHSAHGDTKRTAGKGGQRRAAKSRGNSAHHSAGPN